MAEGSGVTRTSSSSSPKGISTNSDGQSPVDASKFKMKDQWENGKRTTSQVAAKLVREIENVAARAQNMSGDPAENFRVLINTDIRRDYSYGDAFFNPIIAQRRAEKDTEYKKFTDAVEKRIAYIEKKLTKKK